MLQRKQYVSEVNGNRFLVTSVRLFGFVIYRGVTLLGEVQENKKVPEEPPELRLENR
jgi:hypothetical protein